MIFIVVKAEVKLFIREDGALSAGNLMHLRNHAAINRSVIFLRK